MLASNEFGRRERTYVGGFCTACEEPLEHILRGEQIIQLTCGHISHEACIYEYIKETGSSTCPTCDAPLAFDTSRGGSIDYEGLNRLVNTVRAVESQLYVQSSGTTPISWERRIGSSMEMPLEEATAKYRFQSAERPVQNPSRTRTSLNSGFPGYTSAGTGAPMYTGTLDPRTSMCRKCEDTRSRDSTMAGQPLSVKYSIQDPSITLRSEFPYITQSRKQQSLTCMVTVEVGESRWPVMPSSTHSSADGQTIIPDMASATSPPQHLRYHDSDEAIDSVHDQTQDMEDMKDDLCSRVEDWHGLDPSKFGQLQLTSKIRVGKDRKSWQELDCYLFTEMLICIKEKRVAADVTQPWDSDGEASSTTRYILKGSILLKKHLERVSAVPDLQILTLRLSVLELREFHLLFGDMTHLDTWMRALRRIDSIDPLRSNPMEHKDMVSASKSDDEEPTQQDLEDNERVPSQSSSTRNASLSHITVLSNSDRSYTALSDESSGSVSLRAPLHIPIDLMVVIPLSSSIHGLKVDILRDSLRFLLSVLGERDRMGIISFGSTAGTKVLAPLTTKHSPNWHLKLDLVQSIGEKSARADVVEGANAAMDVLLRRRSSNPLSQVLLVSDTIMADHDNVDLLVSRAKSSNAGIHSFGLGMTHDSDVLVELSKRTKASYTYVKDWMMLRECLAGCLGSLQSISHQNAKLSITLPEGSPSRIAKISGSPDSTQKTDGRNAEIELGDLRYGDKRDVLIQLALQPTRGSDSIPTDHWDDIISGLPPMTPVEQRELGTQSIEEVPILQADLHWNDILRNHHPVCLPRPSLLTVTRFSTPGHRDSTSSRPVTPTTPPHPYIVQRRLECLTADMLSRALLAVQKGHSARASHMLEETRLILKKLRKRSLLPPTTPPPTSTLPPTPAGPQPHSPPPMNAAPFSKPSASPSLPDHSTQVLGSFVPGAGIDPALVAVLDHELSSNLEWITHPDVLGCDSRKAVRQAVAVIRSQRGFTFRSPAEAFWASRISGIKRLSERSREWRDLRRGVSDGVQ